MFSMKFFSFSSKYALRFLLGLAVFTCIGRAWAVEMVAHRAFYSLKLGAVSQGSDFVGAQGSMGLSMERTCDGWTMSQTLRMDLTTPDGGEVSQGLRFTAWESDDRTRYRFFASNNVNGVREDFRGRALKGTANGTGNANYRIPEGLKVPLPKGTLFPLSHTFWLIKQALAGERQVTNTVFDGADAEGAQQVTAFIGPKMKYGEHITKEEAEVLGPLSQRPGWNIRMGFYKLDSQNSVPDYEVEILQLDNGITPSLILDYQDFTVILTQERLEEISLPDCQ
jgi:hypothetical protein